jgi:hypothetical protein
MTRESPATDIRDLAREHIERVERAPDRHASYAIAQWLVRAPGARRAKATG